MCVVETTPHGYKMFGNQYLSDLADRVVYQQDYVKGESMTETIERVVF
mgnify:FL=1